MSPTEYNNNPIMYISPFMALHKVGSVFGQYS
jgi:hypothetical protein